MDNRKSQESKILKFLSQGHALTPLTALQKFQTLRLSGRIFALRQQGYQITSSLVKTKSGKHVAQYRMVQESK